MQIIAQQANQYVLKLNRGEDLIEQLKAFCAAENITGGFFVGLGASAFLKLAFYNLAAKQYEEHEFNQLMEIASLTGNVGMFNGAIIVHAHGTFAGEDLQAIAGHVMQLVVGGACELKFDKFDHGLARAYDAETGLNLLK